METDEELIAADEELTSLAPLKKAMGSDQQLQHLNVSVSCCNVICGLSGCRAAVNLCDCEQFNRLTELNGLQHVRICMAELFPSTGIYAWLTGSRGDDDVSRPWRCAI